VGKINVDYPGLLKLFPEYINPKRSESASFLIWYLENYYRLDGLEAVDSVCDKRGDKGVDGIFLNDNDKTLTVFQARINQSSDTTIGDASLRAFAGTLSQFKKPSGEPYLEPHHIRRLSDGGPDHPRWVVAVCPNCHRRAHHAGDAAEYNGRLADVVLRLEGQE